MDIKDKKIRITYTVQYYDVIKSSGGGIMGAIGGTIPVNGNEKWALESCYPFVEKDQHKAKKTSSKALSYVNNKKSPESEGTGRNLICYCKLPIIVFISDNSIFYSFFNFVHYDIRVSMCHN